MSDPIPGETYDQYINRQGQEIKADYPSLPWTTIYYITHPNEAPPDYFPNSGGNEGGSSTPVTPPAIPQIKTWQDFATFYGGQPGKLADMPDEMKAMQSGAGAQSLWGKYIDTSMADKSQIARDVEKQKFNDAFSKYEAESGARAVAGAEPLGWHQFLINNMGEQGAAKDFAYMTPFQRGEQPLSYGTRQRVYWE